MLFFTHLILDSYMKRLTSLVLSMTTTAMLAAPLLTQAAAPQASTLTDLGFSYKGQYGSVMPICYGDRIGTGYPEDLPNVSICDGITEINVGYNGKIQNSLLIKTLLPTDSSEYGRREDRGIIWLEPEVVRGSVKNSLLIRADVVDNYTGVTPFHAYQTYVYDFSTKEIKRTVDTTRNTVWNKAGTRGLFIPITCGGGGCAEDAQLQGVNLLTGTTTKLQSMKASYSGQRSGSELDFEGGTDKDLKTWKSYRWITDRQYEATYMTTDHKLHTIRGTF